MLLRGAWIFREVRHFPRQPAGICRRRRMAEIHAIARQRTSPSCTRLRRTQRSARGEWCMSAGICPGLPQGGTVLPIAVCHRRGTKPGSIDRLFSPGLIDGELALATPWRVTDLPREFTNIRRPRENCMTSKEDPRHAAQDSELSPVCADDEAVFQRPRWRRRIEHLRHGGGQYRAPASGGCAASAPAATKPAPPPNAWTQSQYTAQEDDAAWD